MSRLLTKREDELRKILEIAKESWESEVGRHYDKEIAALEKESLEQEALLKQWQKECPDDEYHKKIKEFYEAGDYCTLELGYYALNLGCERCSAKLRWLKKNSLSICPTCRDYIKTYAKPLEW